MFANSHFQSSIIIMFVSLIRTPAGLLQLSQVFVDLHISQDLCWQIDPLRNLNAIIL